MKYFFKRAFDVALRGGRFTYVNWWKTWVFNLRAFPFKTAVKRPVYVYNAVDLIHYNKIVLDTPNIYKGMIRIGFWPMKAHNKTRISSGGTIIFHGSVDIWGGCIIEGDGTLEFGDNVALAESCKVMCMNHITFQDHVRVGYETTFMDTDFHYTINTETLTVHRNTGEVVIGEGSWVSSNCKVMKGSRLPRNSVVAGGCLVNRDYSGEAEAQVFVGTPAKPVKGNTRRIFNVKVEDKLNRYFRQHPDEKTYTLETDDLDSLCYDHFFRNR